jgi:predicted DCC family thiol-disulfide oxidoreductase YuxK
MRHDQRACLNFMSAQSPTGQALYRHYGIVMSRPTCWSATGRHTLPRRGI